MGATTPNLVECDTLGIVGTITQGQEEFNLMTKEINRMKGLLMQQNDVVRDLLQELTEVRQRKPKAATSLNYLKPMNKSQLELKQLHGVETKSYMNRIFDRVETCILEPRERIKVAQTRLDIPLANLVQAEIFAYRIKFCSWESFKGVLWSQFMGRPCVFQLWHELGDESYEVHEAPRAFANKLICKYSALTPRFLTDTLPDRDKLIKK